jgi:hypothetical protein
MSNLNELTKIKLLRTLPAVNSDEFSPKQEMPSKRSAKLWTMQTNLEKMIRRQNYFILISKNLKILIK